MIIQGAMIVCENPNPIRLSLLNLQSVITYSLPLYPPFLDKSIPPKIQAFPSYVITAFLSKLANIFIGLDGRFKIVGYETFYENSKYNLKKYT